MKKKEFKLPPTEFSNAMNSIYKNDWNCIGWETSRSWRLFNAGMESASRIIEYSAGELGRNAGRIARQ